MSSAIKNHKFTFLIKSMPLINRKKMSARRSINVYSIDWKFIGNFYSSHEAADYLIGLGYEKANSNNVCHACHGKIRLYREHRFVYSDEKIDIMPLEYDDDNYDEEDWMTWKRTEYSAYLMSKSGKIFSFYDDVVKTPDLKGWTQLRPTEMEKEKGYEIKNVNAAKYAFELYNGYKIPDSNLPDEYKGLFFQITKAPNYYVCADMRVYNAKLRKMATVTEKKSGKGHEVRLITEKGRPCFRVEDLIELYVPNRE